MQKIPVLYFSFRSPYSWLAIERLRKARPDMHDHIDFIPVWNPDAEFTIALKARNAGFHYVEMSRAKHRYILADVRRLSQLDGLTITWPIDHDPHWELPNLAWLASRKQGADKRFYSTLVNARWERGENICDPHILRRLATEAGLDPDVPAIAAQDPATQAEALRCLTTAWAEDIFGFPYFRIGPHRYWGIDRLPDFLETLEGPPHAIAEVSPQIPPFEEDTGGGCG